MTNYTVLGRDNGKNVVQYEGGPTELLTDEELAALGGGDAAKRIKERKNAAEKDQKIEETASELERLATEVARLESENASKDQIIEDLEAEVRELRNKLNGESAEALQPSAVNADKAAAAVTLPEKKEEDAPPAITIEEALTVKLFGLGSDQLRAIADVLGLDSRQSNNKLMSAITAERERRAGS